MSKQQIVRIYASAQMAVRDPNKLNFHPETKELLPPEEELLPIVDDLAIEFKKWPVPEAFFDKAMNDLLQAIKHGMKKKGLLT